MRGRLSVTLFEGSRAPVGVRFPGLRFASPGAGGCVTAFGGWVAIQVRGRIVEHVANRRVGRLPLTRRVMVIGLGVRPPHQRRPHLIASRAFSSPARGRRTGGPGC